MQVLFASRAHYAVVFWLIAGCPIRAADTPNVLLLCIDDLRPELACFGKDYVKSPHIDKLAARGRAFHRPMCRHRLVGLHDLHC